MDWDLCKKEHIRKVEPDESKIKSILKMCSVRLRMIKTQKTDEETASILIESYYEIIKELLTALLLKHGLKSDNHECLISFFKKNYLGFEYEVGLIYELKNIRNKITYEGVFVDKNYLMKNKLEFEHIIDLLNSLITKKAK